MSANTLLKTVISFTKVGNDNQTPLAGAEFTLYTSDGKTQIDWNKNIEWSGKNKNEALEDIYLKEEDRVWHAKEMKRLRMKDE